jgi:hypothetical protein
MDTCQPNSDAKTLTSCITLWLNGTRTYVALPGLIDKINLTIMVEMDDIELSHD